MGLYITLPRARKLMPLVNIRLAFSETFLELDINRDCIVCRTTGAAANSSLRLVRAATLGRRNPSSSNRTIWTRPSRRISTIGQMDHGRRARTVWMEAAEAKLGWQEMVDEGIKRDQRSSGDVRNMSALPRQVRVAALWYYEVICASR